MERRPFLAAAVGLAGTIGGCSGVLGDSGDGEPSGPADVASAFVEVIIDGDVETAERYIHENASVGEGDRSQLESFQSVNPELEGASVQSREDDRAVVEVRISRETTPGERRTESVEWELRTEDGEWRLYDDLSAFGSPPNAPAVQWAMESRTNDDRRVTAVTFVHSGGDDVDPARLGARVGELTAGPPSASEPIHVGDVVVVPLDAEGDSIAPDAEVSLTWSDPDGDATQTLASYDLPAETAGSFGATLRLD